MSRKVEYTNVQVKRNVNDTTVTTLKVEKSENTTAKALEMAAKLVKKPYALFSMTHYVEVN